MSELSILDRVVVVRPAVPRDDRQFVISCGIACEQALISAAVNARDGREAWRDYDLDRAARLAQAALFVARGGSAAEFVGRGGSRG